MFINLIRYSLRSFKRQRAYIIINVLGLSIGIACSLLIAFYLINEVSYDRYNAKKGRIFRLIQDVNSHGQEYVASFTPAVMGPVMQMELPEVEGFLRMTRREPAVVEYNNQAYTENHLIEADSSFFNFFSIKVIKGDSRDLLNAPLKIVLSESTARKIFGEENPVGKLLNIGSDTVRYTVTGVMADIPENSHFDAGIIVSFMTNPRSADQNWTNNSFSTYLLLKPNTNSKTVDEKITAVINKYVGAAMLKEMGISMSDWLARGNKFRYYLQNLTDIHLDPSIQQEFKSAGDPKYLKIITSLAILIIIIAAINFMNLSTAQASRRAKEVGIKKAGGSARSTLIIQFLIESFILTLISLVVALILIKVSFQSFNSILGSHLPLKLFATGYTIPFLILFTLVVGFLSGSYPAFFLSSFNPSEVLKGSVKNSMQGRLLRRVLVVFQFTISIFLISGTIIMYSQIKFILRQDMGFNKEQIIVINSAETLGTRMNSFKDVVKKIPGVINIVGSSAVPGRNNNSIRYKMEGGNDETLILETNYIDYDYLETYGINIESGRSLNQSFPSDQQSCLINESAVKDFGITDLDKARFIRKRDPNSSEYLQVIGVVKNFHFKSLHNKISPYLFRLKADDYPGRYLSVKLLARNYSKTIIEIQNTWKEFTGKNSLEYYFIDDDFEQMYSQEKANARMAVIFSILAIFIASLGLFGLTSFTVEQRTKEIGVRKAMGSSLTGIYITMSREVIILVTVSALIALPIIYYIAGNWLENFYYKITPGAFSFMAGFAIALGIAVLTISYRILRAAKINPAQSLKYE
jgi:putative ABC transport system permease protein